ncbi:MAG TPA: hypothetical protein PKA32_04450, partial [Candidatus Gracilibacteria bacterium]|nr:hypothetical protein [Candidatus Gracilibacteria bacterium]
MQYRKLRYLVTLVPVLVLAVVVTPRQQERPAAESYKEPSKVEKLYNSWKERHEQTGGDTSIALGLGPMKGVTPAGSRGNGLARLDLVKGQMTVQARLPEGSSWKAWALYNKQGTSALPDKDDRIIELGTLNDGKLTASIAKEPVDA